MSKYYLGDSIKIKVNMNEYSYDDNMVISYISNDKIITCGHCLPINSSSDIGKIIYSSGFDNKNEGNEIGIMKINDRTLFSNRIDDKIVKLLPNNFISNLLKKEVFNYYKRSKIYGEVIGIINSENDLLKIEWNLDNPITKLKMPYILISSKIFEFDYDQIKDLKKRYKIIGSKIGKLTKSGYSGSPWIININKKLYLIGIHIGKTIGVHKKYNIPSEIAYVRILN